MVISAQRLASEAGAQVLRDGGNAVDAAVAVGFALAVVNPCCGNLGGGGFMLVRMADGRATAFDFRETAPAASTPTMYQDASGKPIPDASLLGWRAAGVPGTVAGLELARATYGTRTLATLIAPARHLADGFVLTRADADVLAYGAPELARDPEASRIFLHADHSPLGAGERLVQTDLAATLDAIAAAGPAAFYRGPIATDIAASSRAGGGILTEADLAAYAAIPREPLRCAYRGLDLLAVPPPSSGGVTVCEILGVAERTDLASLGWHGAASVHVVAEAMRHAFFDRNAYLGDPGFVANPIDWLLSPAHLDAIHAAIGPRATPTATLAAGQPPHERAETTAYSVVDAAGNAVSVTYTLNGAFGAGVVARGTGVLLNDEMDDFATEPGAPNMFGLVQGVRNAIAPGKRPLSSMAPTIALRDGELAMVLGSPGGSRIITAVAETIMNQVDFGMSPQEAVDAPRIHMQGLPDQIAAEPRALSPDTTNLLRDMGYRIAVQRPWGAVALIATVAAAPPAKLAPSGHDAALSGAMLPGLLYGALDARRPAGAAIAADAGARE
jgi:gamma-glutamyltranspeptidase/glutathione hydrolase